MVACGQCPTCQAGRKNDWAGRLIAEASTAKDVYFVTLTYKKEPSDFVYMEVQKMLKHLRTDLARNHPGTGVRFFCVGERGNKKGRIHWHLLLFFDRPHLLRRTKPRELWQFWQHGWTSIDHVPQHDIVRRVRYCAKYAVKTVGNNNACRLRCSLKPAIGGAFLTAFAVDLATAGLPVKGFFVLPGMVWERGHRKGEHVRYRLKGSSARTVCRVYCETWERVRPRKAWPTSQFLARYYPEEMMERYRLWPDLARPRLGRLALEAMPKLSFRPRENQFNHLEGVPVHVHETPEEADAREALEERVAARRAAHEEFSLENGHLPARAFRDTCARRLGLSVEEGWVARYIETGIFGADAPAIDRDRLADEVAHEGGSLGGGAGSAAETQRRLSSAAASRKSAENERRLFAAAEAAFAARTAISKAGFDPVEDFDPETGEVFWRAAERVRSAKPEKPEPVEAVEGYFVRIGSLAARAIRRSIGSAEARAKESEAREVAR